MASSSQSTVNNEEITQSTIPDLVDRCSTTQVENGKLPVNKEISESIIPDLIRRLTKDKNLFPDMSEQQKLINSLNEVTKFYMNSGDKNAGGALVKAVLQRLIHEIPYLRTDDVQELNKDDLHKLDSTVSKLKLQLQGDLISSPPVSKINETIIPAVLARLDLASKYSLFQGTGEQVVQKLRDDLTYIRGFLMNLEENFNNLGEIRKNFEGNTKVFFNALLRHSGFDDLGSETQAEPKERQDNLGLLNRLVVNLKQQISWRKYSTDFDAYRNTQVSGFDYSQVLDRLPDLHVFKKFKNGLAFRDFRKVYESLEFTTKMCLLCFAVIPENEVVKKRFMRHWWVGEGLVSPPPGKTYEEAADEIFAELVKNDCIEPANEKLRLAVDSYKMCPFIRSAVIVLAKEAQFFDFDDKWNFSCANLQSSYRACLVHGCSQELLKSGSGLKLQVLFNVNVPYPDVFCKLQWFSKLKNVKVVYLGRWQTSAKHHIEVESVEFLKGLKSMKLLRFLSLQGISRIRELPRSVCKLLNLRILDLRACHNLVVLPDGIGSLKMLTHLDISECYLRDNMPKGIGTLSKLQVLKGFVISDHKSHANSCTLDDLSRLEKLGKLSIYTNKKAFPEEEDVSIFLKFVALQKLTITWGAGTQRVVDSNAKQDKGDKLVISRAPRGPLNKIVFETLEKLDLKSCLYYMGSGNSNS